MKTIATLAFLSIIFSPLAVSAQGISGNTVSGSVNSATTAIKGAVARCQIVESKIQTKVVRFDNSKVKHLEIYAKVKERVTTLITKLDAQGVDTASLKSALSAYDQKIAKFSNDYAIYIEKLKETQVYVCGKSEGSFLAKLKEAKTALAQVHQDALSIRNHYAQVLKPEINRIRENIRVKRSTSTQAVTSDIMPEALQDDLPMISEPSGN